MHQGRSGSDVCEHSFSKMRYVNSNPNIQQAKECASKVSSAVGMGSRVFRGGGRGNAATAGLDEKPEDLMSNIERTDTYKPSM